MGGGLIQLVAYGAQDIYLTTDPEITFFKSVYKRHTHYAMESILQAYDGRADFGDQITVIIARNGDLVGNICIEAQLPDVTELADGDYDTFGWMQSVGNYLINIVNISIGGQKIDEQYGVWLDIWSELTLTGGQKKGYGQMVGKDYSSGVWNEYQINKSPGNRVFIPLQFWFCRNPGLAIPLIALQYTEVKVDINISKYSQLLVATKDGNYVKPEIIFGSQVILTSFKVYAEYYFLDSTERRQFAQNAHEYLIEQLQSQSGNMTSIKEINNIRINLNNPTKELIFLFNRNNSNSPQNDFSLGANKIPNGPPSKYSPLYSFKLIINGHDRFRTRPGEYFRLVQPYNHHTSIPDNYIYIYSFALRPEEHQPSGTCNFTRIDNAFMEIIFRNTDTNPGNLDSIPEQNYSFVPGYTLFAPSYNILRILGGMGGLAYST